MRSILDELWYGNVCPNGGCRELTPEAKQLMKYIADHHDNLQATLTDKQKEILEKFDDCYAELTDINEREIKLYQYIRRNPKTDVCRTAIKRLFVFRQIPVFDVCFANRILFRRWRMFHSDKAKKRGPVSLRSSPHFSLY